MRRPWLRLALLWAVAPLAFSSAQNPSQPPPSSPVPAMGKYSISGVVQNASTGALLGRAEVTLNLASDGRMVAETTTGDDGAFVFPHLAAAKYGLVAARRGYVTASYEEHGDYSSAIVTGEGLVSDGLVFRLAPQAVLYGVVTDDWGDPVAQAQVSVFRQNMRTGLGNIVRVQQTQTDDLGAYEIAGLQPGDYFIAVSARPWYTRHAQPAVRSASDAPPPRSPLDVAYPRTFYSDVTDANLATPIPVKPGDRVPVNFSLHAVPALHFSIRLPIGGGDQRDLGARMPQFQQEVFGTKEPVQAVTSFVSQNSDDKNGTQTLEIGGLPPGDYEVEMRGGPGAAGRISDLHATEDVQLDALQGAPLADVSGKVAMADGGKLPEGLRVLLRSTDGQFAGGAMAEKDGTFAVHQGIQGEHGVAPGTYELVVNSPGQVFAVSRMAATGAAADGHLLKIGSEPVIVAATLAEGSATVTGFAKLDGKPLAGVMIVLVPKNPGVDGEMFRRDQSDSDGSFTLNRVVPGEYTVVAIEEAWALDWARPAVIGHYLRHGLRVVVPAHTKEVALPSAVPVQLK